MESGHCPNGGLHCDAYITLALVVAPGDAPYEGVSLMAAPAGKRIGHRHRRLSFHGHYAPYRAGIQNAAGDADAFRPRRLHFQRCAGFFLRAHCAGFQAAGGKIQLG